MKKNEKIIAISDVRRKLALCWARPRMQKIVPT